jgi:hypothetical protein
MALWSYFKINRWTVSGIIIICNIRGICHFPKSVANCDRRPFARVATFTYFNLPELHPQWVYPLDDVKSNPITGLDRP